MGGPGLSCSRVCSEVVGVCPEKGEPSSDPNFRLGLGGVGACGSLGGGGAGGFLFLVNGGGWPSYHRFLKQWMRPSVAACRRWSAV